MQAKSQGESSSQAERRADKAPQTGDFDDAPVITDWVSDDEDEQADEYVTQYETVQEGVIEDEEGERVVNLKNVRRAGKQAVSEQGDASETPAEEETYEQLKAKWFSRKTEEVVQEDLYRKSYSTANLREPRKGILCWMYDAEIKLFVIRRFDGIQYLKKDIKKFSSLTLYDLRDLARLDIINRSDDEYAKYVQRQLRNEVRTQNWDRIKPAKGKWMIDKTKMFLDTGKFWTKIVYPPVDTEKKIPLRKMPQDVLGNLDMWAVDTVTGEAVMYKHDDESPEYMTELLRVYEPNQLVNLSRNDLLKLNEKRIVTLSGWEDFGRKYSMVVRGCVNLGLHYGSELNRQRQ